MILLLKHFTLLTIWYCGPWSFCGNYSGVHPKNIWLCIGKAKWRECESIFRRCLSLINLLLYGNNIPGGLPSYLWELQLFFFTLINELILRRSIWTEFQQWRDCGNGKELCQKLPIPISSQLACKPLSCHCHYSFPHLATTFNPFFSSYIRYIRHYTKPIIYHPCMTMHGCITFIPRSCSSCAHLIPSVFMPIVMPIISHSSSTLLTHMGLMPTHFSS